MHKNRPWSTSTCADTLSNPCSSTHSAPAMTHYSLEIILPVHPDVLELREVLEMQRTVLVGVERLRVTKTSAKIPITETALKNNNNNDNNNDYNN